MFDPDEKKAPRRRRSLLDLAPDEAARAAVAEGRAPRSLLDGRMEQEDAAPRARRNPRLSLDRSEDWTPPFNHRQEPQQYAGVGRPSVRQRLSDWFSGLTARDERDALPYFNPAPIAAGYPQPHDAGLAETVPEDDYADRERPLIDLELVARSVWRLRWLIAALTLTGAVAGVIVAKGMPNRYISESRLYIDPRDISLTDSDLSNQALSTEAILAIVDSQMQVLTSPKVLEKVSAELELERDPEFGGGGAPSASALLRELVFGPKLEEEAAGRAQAAMETLYDAVSVSRDEKTFVIAVSVTTEDAEKSALIANKVVATFLSEESNAQSGYFERTTEALDDRLTALNKELDAAENAVEKFKADNDIIDAAGKLIADNQLIALNDQVSAAGNQVAIARAKAETTAGVSPSDVLSGSFPEQIASPTLTELRTQYTTASAEFGSLSSRLGPRHPQRVAAEQSLEAVRGEIRNELRRIASAANTELQRAVETQADLTRQLAQQKARQVNASVELVKLRELERNAAATRAIYESFLKRARETSEEQKLTSKNIRVISQAEPASRPAGPSRKFIAAGGMLAGLFAGIGLGVLLGMYRSLTSTFGFAAGRRTPHDGHPTDTPPRGRGRLLDGEVPAHWNRYPEPRSDFGYAGGRGTYGASASVHDEEVERQPEADKPAAQPSITAVIPQIQTYGTFFGAGSWSPPAASAPAPVQKPAQDDGMDRVHDDLRALRAKVERYARQKGRTRA